MSTTFATTYYVATTGSDTNSGTNTGAPFLTISKAASVMTNAGDACAIFSGVYRETVTVTHSGTAAAPITFAAYNSSQTPIISGANVLNATWTTYTNSIYQASITNSFRQLFVDGAMMNEARWPNANVDQLLTGTRSTVGALSGTNNTALIDTNLPTNLNLVGATMQIMSGPSGLEYAGTTKTITNYDNVAQKISWSGGTAYGMNPGNPYYLYGILPLLDVATEWCLVTNTPSNTLYLWTPSSTSPAAHTVEYKARNTAFVLDNQSYVNLTGLYIFGAGITMNNSTNCIVNGCDMRYVQHNTTADYYATLTSQSTASGTSNVWENSTVMFSSQDGIQLNGTNNTVTNCFISQVDYYPGKYYASVNALSGQGQEVVHNSLIGSGRAMVYHPVPGIEIAYNDMESGQQLTKDGGATYAWETGGMTTGGVRSRIHNNWAINSGVGIYLDKDCTNFDVYQNVCRGNAEDGMILNANSLSNNIVNNTILDSATSFYTWGGGTGATNGQQQTVIINNLIDGNSIFSTGAIAPMTLTNNGWYPSLGANYVPLAGSGAIGAGITNAFNTNMGTPPDIGAYQEGGTYWTPGANLGHGIGVQLIKPFPLPGTPATPTGVTAAWTSTQNTLTWTVSGSATSYNIKRSSVSGGPYTTIGTATATTPGYLNTVSYLDTGLTANTPYYYVVSAVNATGESDNSAEAAVATDTVPSPWLNQDIGTVGLAGSSGYLNGVFSLNGAAPTIGQADAYQYTYQPMTGNGTIIARLADEGSIPTAQAGLVIRETLASGATMAALVISPSEMAEFGTRAATGSWPVWQASPNPTLTPHWIKLVRSGNVFSGYLSTDGLSWTQVGTSTTISMATSAYVGMAVTSGTTTEMSTVTFDNVSVLLAPWLSQDIGAVGLPGQGSYNLSNVFSVTGSGVDIYGTNDVFQYTYQPMTNDGSIVARITGTGGKAGVMIRETLTPGSTTATIILSSSGTSFGTRATNNATTAWQTVAGVPPEWLKLTRSSNSFSAYTSPDGSSWTQIGTAKSISMATNSYIGFPACSRNITKLITATFDNVTVVP